MKNQASGVKGWRQEGLFPAQGARITCEVVTDQGGNLNTFHVRAVDTSDERLIAAWSLPLRGVETFEQDLHETVGELLDLARHHVLPF